MKKTIAVFMLCLLIAMSLFPISASAAGGNLYVLNYFGNDGTSYGMEYIYDGASVTVKDASDMNVSRRGYSFVEWNTTIDGMGKAYSAGDTIVINNHVNLYAQWKRDSESNTGSTFDNSSPYIGSSNIPPPVEPVINYTFVWPIFILCICACAILILRGWVLRQKNIRRGDHIMSYCGKCGNVLPPNNPVGVHPMPGIPRTPSSYIAGGIFGLVSSILFLIFFPAISVSFPEAILIDYTAIRLIVVLCMCASMVSILRGCILRSRVHRYYSYTAQFGSRRWCSVEELAAGVRKSERYVESDISKMIRLGYFPGARLVKEHRCLILNEDGYKDYQAAKQEAAAQEREDEHQREADEKTARETEPEREIRLTIEQGGKYVHEINIAAETLSEQDVSAKLKELEGITKRIFAHIEKYPEQIPKISRFMDYYLPTTIKLIDTYKELDNKSVEGKNMASSKKEITGALDLINTSFGKLLDGLYENISMDISTDISVLEVLLAQEGLTKEDFTKGANTGGQHE